MNTRHYPKILYLFAFATWMTFITCNNINDPNTNLIFIKQVIGMSLFERNSGVGEGLLWRSINIDMLPQILLYSVILIEIIIDILMWGSLYAYIKDLFNKDGIREKTLDIINLSITAWMALFTCFICSGMWFGYWMHHGAFQMVHLTGLIIGLIGYIIFNQTGTQNNTNY